MLSKRNPPTTGLETSQWSKTLRSLAIGTCERANVLKSEAKLTMNWSSARTS